MTDTKDPRPSLAELRAMGEDETITKAALTALLDITKAAQAVAHEAEFYDDDDTRNGSLIVVPRADMEKLDEALAKVRP